MIPTATPNIREVRTLSQSQAKFQSTLSLRHTTLNNLLANSGPTSALLIGYWAHPRLCVVGRFWIGAAQKDLGSHHYPPLKVSPCPQGGRHA